MRELLQCSEGVEFDCLGILNWLHHRNGLRSHTGHHWRLCSHHWLSNLTHSLLLQEERATVIQLIKRISCVGEDSCEKQFPELVTEDQNGDGCVSECSTVK